MVDVRFKLADGAVHAAGFCERNLNLLAHAQAIELDIGSECGGHGICGKDRIQLQPGPPVSPYTEAEREHLGPALLAQGWRLACQCFPESNDEDITALVP